ncbi:MAG: hypothetical protein WD801_06325 [Gemmatimonadaceae bacterium]
MTLGAASCTDSTGPTEDDIRNVIAALATSGGTSASFHAGAPPAGGSGPSVNVTGSSSMITGGSSMRNLASSQSFSRIIVAIEGLDGYWEVTLPSSVTSQDIILTLGQDITDGSFTVQYAGGTSGGVGSFDSESVNVVSVGTGDVQVSVSWNSNADVDLHVVEPNGEEIYYGNASSASGGSLDLDSNASCSGDNVRNENVTWPTASPPRGTYTVRVDYWSACSVSSTSYVVTVRVAGSAPTTFQGTFTGSGNGGGEGDGTLVTTFTY